MKYIRGDTVSCSEFFLKFLVSDGERSPDGAVRRPPGHCFFGEAFAFALFSFWRALYEPPTPDANKQDVVDKEDAETALKRMIDENDPATENTRHLLALMLERKKILKQIDAQEKDGRRLVIYCRRKTQEIYIVPDPGLGLDEIASLQAEVIDMIPM